MISIKFSKIKPLQLVSNFKVYASSSHGKPAAESHDAHHEKEQSPSDVVLPFEGKLMHNRFAKIFRQEEHQEFTRSAYNFFGYM